MIKLYIFIRKK